VANSNRVAYLKTLKASKLKSLCRAMRVAVSGNKSALAGRIAACERKAINGR
jgi:hypothetical protein